MAEKGPSLYLRPGPVSHTLSARRPCPLGSERAREGARRALGLPRVVCGFLGEEACAEVWFRDGAGSGLEVTGSDAGLPPSGWPIRSPLFDPEGTWGSWARVAKGLWNDGALNVGQLSASICPCGQAGGHKGHLLEGGLCPPHRMGSSRWGINTGPGGWSEQQWRRLGAVVVTCLSPLFWDAAWLSLCVPGPFQHGRN